MSARRPGRSGRYTPPARRPVLSLHEGPGQGAAIRAHLRAVGCRCDVELEWWVDEAGCARVTVHHDAWCPLWLRVQAGGN